MAAIDISIIIPHLNQLQLLERCLNSLAPQILKHPRTEVIVVDNGSAQLPTSLCSQYPFVKLLTESTRGPGPARNRGISESNGQILALIDADCVAEENWLKEIIKIFSKPDAPQVVGGDVRILYVYPKNLTKLEAYESVFAYRQKEYIEKMNFSGTGNMAMHRRTFDSVGPFAGIEVAEDRAWGALAHQKGVKIIYDENMIVFHPARTSFFELTKKWDRHIAHDFNEVSRSIHGKLSWVFLLVAVAASGIVDIRKIIATRRISGMSNRCKAALILIKVRGYRAGQMARILLKNEDKQTVSWNRGQ